MADKPNTNRAPIIIAIPVALALASAGLDPSAFGFAGAKPRNPAEEAETVMASELTAEQRELVEEHVFGGLPSLENLRVRHGYVSSFLPEARIPSWVAYHVTPDYLGTPKRTGRFSSFRVDPDDDRPVRSDDYLGLSKTRGYARGHLAPYAVMGGDRNRDGRRAPDDEFDSTTVFQANFMSNIAPQHHDAFNGSGGLWFELERRLQDVWVRQEGHETWVFSGCVLGRSHLEAVGPDADILVPPMFFSIVVRQPDPDQDDDLPEVLAFLFPHQRKAHGEIEDFLVTVDVIEALTGLDFFHELSDPVEIALEDTDTVENWPLFQPIQT